MLHNIVHDLHSRLLNVQFSGSACSSLSEIITRFRWAILFSLAYLQINLKIAKYATSMTDKKLRPKKMPRSPPKLAKANEEYWLLHKSLITYTWFRKIHTGSFSLVSGELFARSTTACWPSWNEKAALSKLCFKSKRGHILSCVTVWKLEILQLGKKATFRQPIVVR